MMRLWPFGLNYIIDPGNYFCFLLKKKLYKKETILLFPLLINFNSYFLVINSHPIHLSTYPIYLVWFIKIS